MVHKKSGSKRQSLKLKYDIQKKVKEHRRKLNKLAKQNPHLRKKVKKDPGIPNLWPFKEQMLDAIARKQEMMADTQSRQQDARKKALEKRRTQLANPPPKQKQQQQQQQQETRDDRGNSNDANRRKWYMKELKQVCEEADVILEVLDARDPMGCRCPALEQQILGKYSQKAGRPKRIIIVLNKIDLVPSDIAARWLKYLRREFPVIAFKSSTEQKRRLTQQRVDATKATDADVARKGCIGGQALVQLLKKFSMNNKVKGMLTVGVVGFPNVGKSSVINSLKRTKAVGVGAMPGFTTSVTTVRLDKNIQLLDSPGVLVTSGTTDSEADLVLRNCLRVDNVQDVVGAAYAIVERCHPAALLQVYQIAQYQTPEQFLFLVGQKRGKLKKGGVPDMEQAARVVLQDWNDGRIPYYTMPPEAQDVSGAQVVQDWANEFDIDDLLNQANTDAMAADSSTAPLATFMALNPSAPSSSSLMDVIEEEEEEEEDDDDDMMAVEDDDEDDDDDEEEEKKEATAPVGRKKQFMVDMNALNGGGDDDDMHQEDEDDDDNDDDAATLKTSNLVRQVNTSRAKAWKAEKKRERKQAARAAASSSSSNDMQDDDDDDDGYDFTRDY